MSDDPRTRHWRRPTRAETVPDALYLLEQSIAELRQAPDDADARQTLRSVAAQHELWEQLATLLAGEARAHAHRPAVAAVFYEELVDAYETLDQPLEAIGAMEALVAIDPDVVAYHDRLAWLYRHAGAWAKAADAFEQVGLRSSDKRAEAALLAAAQLNRENGRLDRAETQYRELSERRPTDLAVWRALDDVLSELGRWREVAAVRGERAARALGGFEKAALLRSQARALEQAGDLPAAAKLVAAAASHAPDHVSGLVDQADLLARGGRGREAADILRSRVSEARERRASTDDVAALRLRLAQVLEDSCEDPVGATAVLDELLGEAPTHLPALERLTAIAATDPDPQVHAVALLRYAAAVPDAIERAAYVAAAGRRLRDSGDLGGAVQAFEQAAALAPDDADIRRTLDEVRATGLVEQAAAATTKGDLDDAERRLREVLATQRHQLAANLALVDVLVSTDRSDAAAEHLRATLETLPDGVPPAATARLVHRLAQIMATLGDADESHQLLHEAHRLDRSSLAVTLALGDSCFARKLWRQAALHLAAAGEHPDAPRHAAKVAAGLVRAAQAEVRALKPNNAGKHYEAAVKIDPACAPAWHGLAEIASERGDLARAAECLEREANATTDAAARLRLFDALGDMALDVLGDPARAERCWAQAGDAADAALLDKLLVLQRKRRPSLELADTLERRARHEPDAAARKTLRLDALQALQANAAIARAAALAEALVAEFPRDTDVLAAVIPVETAAGDPRRAAAWARSLIVVRDADDHRVGVELALALGAPLSDEDHKLLDTHPVRPMASDEAYAAALDDDDRKELIDDPAEAPVRELLAPLAEVLALVCPTATAALAEAGVPEAQRVAASSEAATASVFPQIARALGGPPTLLYTTTRKVDDLTLLPSAPPVVVIGPRLASVRASSHGEAHAATDAGLRFQLGRIVELSRPHRILAAMPEPTFAVMLAAIRHAFGPAEWTATPSEVVAQSEWLRARLPVAVRQRLTERVAALAPDALDGAARAYIAACQRAADRAGLIACGDLTVAIERAGGARAAPHLVRLAASRRYLAVRKKLRTR